MKRLNLKNIFRKTAKFLFGIFLTNEDLPYTATEFRDRISLSPWRWLLHILVGLFWLLLAYIVVISLRFITTPDTLYNVTARSEIITIDSFQNSVFVPWQLDNVRRYAQCGSETSLVSGQLQVAQDTSVYIERIGTDSVWITLSSETLAPVGFIQTDNQRIELTDCEAFELQTSANHSYTLPIDGVMTIGGEVKEASAREPILHDGSVAISDKGAWSGQYYQTEPYALELGDKFFIQNPSIQSSGFIFVDDSPGMQVTFNGKGDAGVIQRYKSEDIILKNSIWTKLAHDESLLFLWLFLVAAFSLLKFVIRVNIE